MINKGNHVIMLEVSIPERLIEAAKEWVKGHTDRQLKLEVPHVTLLFVGKDLPGESQESFHDAASFAASRIWDRGGMNLLSTGKFLMFGGKRDHLVMGVQADPGLLSIQQEVRDFIKLRYHVRMGEQLDIKGDHGVWRPHVTLATGPGQAFVQSVPGVVFPVTGVYVKTGDGNKVTIPVQKS
jgi:2'-5' RNA ligase